MTLTHQLIRNISAVAFAAAIAHSSATATAQTYSVTPLGVLDGKKESSATAINGAGHIAGISHNGVGSEAAVRFGQTDVVEDLAQSLPGTISRGFAIDAKGRVVGDATFFSETPGDKGASRAAMFIKGSVADLGTLPDAGPYSRATGINSTRQIVGFAAPSEDSTETRAFLWTVSTGMIDLGTLGGSYAKATAINDSGAVTGSAEMKGDTGIVMRAFVYAPHSIMEESDQGMQDLGTLGGTDSFGVAINASSHVAGTSAVDEEGRMHAFLHDGEKMQDLGSLNQDGSKSDQSFAAAMNNNDHVVGYSFLSEEQTQGKPAAVFGSPVQAAFLAMNGTMIDLNTLLGKDASNYHLYSASGINDRGQIIASAFDYSSGSYVAVLLTPDASSLQ